MDVPEERLEHILRLKNSSHTALIERLWTKILAIFV